jgi:hypothetical protein
MLQIKDGVRRISLGIEGLLLLHLDDSSANPGMSKIGSRVKYGVVTISHLHGTSVETGWKRIADCEARIEGREQLPEHKGNPRRPVDNENPARNQREGLQRTVRIYLSSCVTTLMSFSFLARIPCLGCPVLTALEKFCRTD